MNILVTGGAGYIGSHTCVALLAAGHRVTVADNLSNSKREAVRRVERIAGAPVRFELADLCDPAACEALFRGEKFDAAIHFAGLKAVGESVEKPLAYYRNNLTCTLNLLDSMARHGVNKLVFSSSATVYGTPERVPIPEEAPLSAASPYGQTKLMIEQILRDACAADPALRVASLRYFNPVGAHESGLIGEDPSGIPNNLTPYITQVAAGRLEKLRVFGGDYPTPDGTGVRDYIHVMDLAQGHLAALERLEEAGGFLAYNLGTGQGVSVLEMVAAFEKAVGRPIPYEMAPRRPGDVAFCYADPAKAERELRWRAERNLAAMCADSWRWQQKNPGGYPEE